MKINYFITIICVSFVILITACQGEKYPESYGLALFTVRDNMHSNPDSTLQAVAEMGYSYIEPAAFNVAQSTFYNMSPTEFKNLCAKHGLDIVSSHIGLMQLADADFVLDVARAERLLDAHKEAGILNVVNPSLPNTMRDEASYYKVAEVLNEIGKLASAKGMRVLHHNHAWEFDKVGEKSGMEILLDETSPEYVDFQMDAYWVVRAGYDPLELMRSYPGRFTIMHVKDMEDSGEQFFSEVGHGTIAYSEIIPMAKAKGAGYFLVEQDRSRREPMESARMSIEYLLSLK